MRHVDPIEARKGQFLKSFPVSQFQDMLDYAFDTEMAMARHRITGEVAYTRIGKGAQERKWDTWQVFLLSPGYELDSKDIPPYPTHEKDIPPA